MSKLQGEILAFPKISGLGEVDVVKTLSKAVL